jgi:hypothetical protein
MSKTKIPVNYVLTGSRYQVTNEKGEQVPEFGVGRFRSGIRLELAMDLYGRMVTHGAYGGSAPDKATARNLAASAFSLTEVFLEEMDKDFHRMFPEGKAPSSENNGRK